MIPESCVSVVKGQTLVLGVVDEMLNLATKYALDLVYALVCFSHQENNCRRSNEL